MIIYIFVAVVYTICAFVNIRFKTGKNDLINKKFTSFILMLPLLTIVALRAVSVGSDTHTYYSVFYRMENVVSLKQGIRAASNMEPGFVLLNLVSNHIGMPYHLFQVLVSIITFYPIYRFIYRYSTNIAFSWLTFFCLRFMFGTMNQVRMWLAISFLLIAFDYLITRKPVPFVFFVGLACLFHVSSLIFLIVYPISLLRIEKKTVLSVVVFSTALFLIGTPVFEWITSFVGKYNDYLTDDRFSISGNIAVFLSLFVDIVFLLVASKSTFWNSFEGCNSEEQVSIQGETTRIELGKCLFWFVTLCVGLDIVGLGNNVMGRITSYFSSTMIISIPIALSKMKKESELLVVFIIVFLVAQVFTILILRPDWYMVTPYKFFWQEELHFYGE